MLAAATQDSNTRQRKTLLTKLDSETVKRTFEGASSLTFAQRARVYVRSVSFTQLCHRVLSGGGRSVLVGLKQHDRSVTNGGDEILMRITVVDFCAFRAL